jgi:hypothetical protein
LANAKDQEEFELCISVGAYFVLGFVCSLRGPEGFMLDLLELLDNIQFGKEDAESHVVAPLLGRLSKGLGPENLAGKRGKWARKGPGMPG